MLKFKPEILKTDVLAVKIVDIYILAGIGNFLYIYDLFHLKRIDRVEIFDGTKICGFVPNKTNNQLLMHGETKLKIYDFNVPNNEYNNICECKGNLEWILATAWIADDCNIVTVSMNNTASLWNLKFELLLKITCAEKCIAYCAAIVNVNNTWKDLVILTGTVFSELLIWRTTINEENKLCSVRRLKGHKGVLFSISYNENNNLICSTSDDRSTIVWKINSNSLLDALLNNEMIEHKLILHGHASRIFNCQLTDNFILTTGEDGLVNIWHLDGKLYRKIDAHLGVNVWSVFCSEEQNIIISGGSGGSVNIFKLDMKIISKTLKNRLDSIKTIAFLNERKIVTITERGSLFLYDLHNQHNYSLIDNMKCMESYAILEISPCKSFCAFGGYHGEIIIYHTNDDFSLQLFTSYQIAYKPRIYSVHWLTNNKLLTCVDDGFIFIWVLKNGILILNDIIQLPPAKERFSTCACALNDDLVAVGDRKGNIYIYGDEVGPKQCLKKAHNFMGLTKLYFKNSRLISLGKDSIMKEYIINGDNILQEISVDKLPFSWITYYHSISDKMTLLAGFKGDKFLVFDYSNRNILFETNCGGGHRSWDIHCNDKALFIAFVKDKLIQVREIDFNNLLPAVLETSYHSKEINTLTSIQYENGYLLLSGGEDTIFRIHKLNISENGSLEEVFVSKSHLSSIRSIFSSKILEDKFYIFSGGGREQIIFWELFINDGNNISCFQRDSYHQTIAEIQSENRIMDICAHVDYGKTCCVCAACSDGNIKVFEVQNSENKLKMVGNIFYDNRCILKLTMCTMYMETFLITMSTDGLVALWSLSPILKKYLCKEFKMTDLRPLRSLKAHSSGINSCSYTFVSGNRIALVTGGDDAKISINLFEGRYNRLKPVLTNSLGHCAQITGVFIARNLLITTAIDQKIVAYQWELGKLRLNSWIRYNSSVADIHGIRVLNGLSQNEPYSTLMDVNCEFNWEKPVKIVVYGKGVEILTLNKYLECS